MLPGFDPYLMGHSSRDHLFDAAHRWKVSRVAGWISPVVLIGGRVVATWSHTIATETLRISVEPFRSLPPNAKPAMRRGLKSLHRPLAWPTSTRSSSDRSAGALDGIDDPKLSLALAQPSGPLQALGAERCPPQCDHNDRHHSLDAGDRQKSGLDPEASDL